MIKQFLSVVIFIASACFAHDANGHYDNEVINAIVANENICVDHYEDEKIYIYSNRICPTQQGLYLNLNDREFLFLPCLASDNHGCYVSRRNPDVLNTCPSCGRKYFISCQNPSCPNNINKREKKENERSGKRDKKDKHKNKRQ